MDYVLYGVIIILVALFFVTKKPAKAPPQKNDAVLPYKKRDDFLSAAELSFYRSLCTTIQNEAVICPKVAIKDVVFVPRNVGKDYMKFFNWIAQKHVDFVLCDSVTMQTICAIELDDKSHQKETRKQRDEFVDRVFEAAKIPLFHVPAKRGYAAGDFDAVLSCLSVQPTPQTTAEAVEPAQDNAEIETIRIDTNVPICPKCDIPMVKRKSTKGANAGKEFYGCSNYPKCREINNL